MALELDGGCGGAVVKKIYAMEPETRSAYLDAMATGEVYDRQLFVISTAEVVSVSVVPPTGKVE